GGRRFFLPTIPINKSKKKAEEELKKTEEKNSKEMEEVMLGNKVKLDNVLKLKKRFDELKQKASASELLTLTQPVFSEWLDANKGHTISDQKIFRAHAQEFEKQFFEDMRVEFCFVLYRFVCRLSLKYTYMYIYVYMFLKALHVRDPDVITRVTEYVPQIVQFVERLVEKGYAYVSNRSVYFNINQFREHVPFPKLDPKLPFVFAFCNTHVDST
ncbi:cysteinyl-tRNA synthetase family protein, partial [Reticulomyxa filosa]